MITKGKLKLGDILVTEHPDSEFRYYIYCYTSVGYRFVSLHGSMSISSYDNNLCCLGYPEWNIKKVFRPSKKYAHTRQLDVGRFVDKLKFPFEKILASSIDITNIDKTFIDLTYYV